jgi:hypothetical protein
MTLTAQQAIERLTDITTKEELRSLMLSAGFESVEPVSNPMPLHTRLLLAQKR